MAKNSHLVKTIIFIIILLSNIHHIKCDEPILLSNGLDATSLYGSNIITNEKFIFVSSNGYNEFEGAVVCYYNSLLLEQNNVLKIHSIIYSPESSNNIFGIKINIHNDILLISAIGYNTYNGVVYVYKFLNNNWILNQKLEPNKNFPYNFPIGFGYELSTNGKYLAIGCTSGQIYLYLLDDKIYKYIYMGNIIGNNNHVNKISFLNNSLITSFDNTLYGYDLENYNFKEINLHYSNSYDYILNPTEHNIDCKYFGKNIKILNNILILSCSIPYPFDKSYLEDLEDLENFNPKIIIYSISHNIKFNTIQLNPIKIISPNKKDIYFGGNFDFDQTYLFVSGTNKIYQYQINDTNLINLLTNIYTIPSNNINNDYKLKIINNILLIGSYGYDDLSGSVYYLDYKNNIKDNNENINNKNISSEKKNIHNIPIVFILFICMLIFLALLITIIIYGCIYYYCVIPNSKLLLNKKKKEEENSPYKVYSYLGYSEMDEYIYGSNNIPNKSYYIPFPYIHPYYNQNYNKKSLDKKEIIIYKSDNIEHIIGGEKVYTYKEYEYDKQKLKDNKL